MAAVLIATLLWGRLFVVFAVLHVSRRWGEGLLHAVGRGASIPRPRKTARSNPWLSGMRAVTTGSRRDF